MSLSARSRLIHFPTFLITIVISIVVLCVFVTLRLKTPLDCEFRRRSGRKLMREAKTGDIIAVAYGSKRAKLIKVFTGSMWAHSCVIIRPTEAKEAYVLEVSRYGERRGIMVTKLKKWLHYNRNFIVGVRPYCGPALEHDTVRDFLVRHEGIREQMFVVDWLAAMVKRPYPQEKEEKAKLFCSELVSRFLQATNVMEKKYHPSGYKPWELLYGSLPLKEEKKYDAPYLIDT
jgi:hypothetical protein